MKTPPLDMQVSLVPVDLGLATSNSQEKVLSWEAQEDWSIVQVIIHSLEKNKEIESNAR